MEFVGQATKLTASGIITSKHAELLGMAIGKDGTNDPTITVHNSTDNSGNEIVPTATYDASALGLDNLPIPCRIDAPDGIYVAISCAGAVEVVVYWRAA